MSLSPEQLTKLSKKRSPNFIGYLLEKMTETYLLSLGGNIHTTQRSKFSNNDLFNLWDHVCILDRTTVWVQTKSREIYGKQLEDMQAFPADYKYLFIWEQGVPGTYQLNVRKL